MFATNITYNSSSCYCVTSVFDVCLLSAKVHIQIPPPPMIVLEPDSVFTITCTAVGVPTPEVVWRLNWGHIPEKCSVTSVGGFGTLTCPNIQVEKSICN